MRLQPDIDPGAAAVAHESRGRLGKLQRRSRQLYGEDRVFPPAAASPYSARALGAWYPANGSQADSSALSFATPFIYAVTATQSKHGRGCARTDDTHRRRRRTSYRRRTQVSLGRFGDAL